MRTPAHCHITDGGRVAMNWQLLGLSFISVFLAELGDKSPLAAIALGGSSKAPRAVFLGTASALLLATLIGVLIGEGAAQVLPTQFVKLAAAAGFMIMAVRLLWPKPAEEAESNLK